MLDTISQIFSNYHFDKNNLEVVSLILSLFLNYFFGILHLIQNNLSKFIGNPRSCKSVINHNRQL